MAPHLRSSYARERRAFLSASGPVNTRGLPSLPAELLLEIISHTTAGPIPSQAAHPLPAKFLERSTTLRALSGLCRSLRRGLLPVLWERVEACAISQATRNYHSQRAPRWQKDIATNLIDQLETVTIREPSLASYVKIVNVLITPYSADTVLEELARCLALMPNLHTVQIIYYLCNFFLPGRRGVVDITDLYRNAFAGHRYSSVRRIALSLDGGALLPCFPEARQIHTTLFSIFFFGRRYYKKDYHIVWVLEHAKEIASHCSKVQIFEWTSECYTSWDIRKNVYEMLPNLRQVQLFVGHDTLESINTLASFKNLDTIVLSVSEKDEAENGKKIELMIVAARAILTASSLSERKALVILRPHTTEIIRSF